MMMYIVVLSPVDIWLVLALVSTFPHFHIPTTPNRSIGLYHNLKIYIFGLKNLTCKVGLSN
jgi:hypothetical protein